MADNPINSSGAITALKEYISDLRTEVHEMREWITKLRIDQAVTKTKLGVYIAIIAFIVTMGTNLLFMWVRTRM